MRNNNKLIKLQNLYLEENYNLSMYTLRNKKNDIDKFINAVNEIIAKYPDVHLDKSNV